MSRPICVIGSSNTDMVVRSQRIPAPGETVLGGEFFLFPGGKGANQAVAAARLGGRVQLVACVGNDAFGKESIERFGREGIDCSRIVTDAVAPSGIAMITVDAAGENAIVVAPGANGRLSEQVVTAAVDELPADAMILLQLEIPMESVASVLQTASRRGMSVILNPAPAVKLPRDWYRHISILTPNEVEASVLTGIQVEGPEAAARAATWFHDAGIPQVVITLGKRGAYCSGPSGSFLVEASVVTVADSTGAGDCFNGALAVALAEGRDLYKAVRFACAAATLSVTRMGAQPAMPNRSEVEIFNHI